MPRDGSGVYTLPPGNPVVPLTVIDTTWANPTMSDLATAMSDSLSRSGKGGMTASLRGPDGSKAQPTFSFTNEPSTGRYRASDGVVVEAVDGNDIVRYTTTGLEQWNGSIWEPLTPRDAINTPFDPSTSALTSTNVQHAIEEVLSFTGGIPEAKDIPYDDTNVYFGAPTVQIAIDTLGIDLAAAINDIGVLSGEIDVINGDLSLLTNRVTTNEQNIAQLQSDVGALDLQFTDFYNDEFLPLRQRVTDVEGIANTNASDISDLQWLTNGPGNPSSLDQRITNNAADIASNLTLIGENTGDIDAILTQLGIWFPGYGDLSPTYGGTGGDGLVTGTGANVLAGSPILTGTPNLAEASVTKPPAVDDSNRVPTTSWVRDKGYLTAGEFTYHSNAYGVYMLFPTHNPSTYRFCVQWGSRLASACDYGTTFPRVFYGGSSNKWFRVLASYESGAAACGLQTSIGIKDLTTTGFRAQLVAGWTFYFIAVGLVQP